MMEFHRPLPANDEMFAGFELMYNLHKKGFDLTCYHKFIVHQTYLANPDLTGDDGICRELVITSIESDLSGTLMPECNNAATWQEILQWFREKHLIYIEIQSSAPNLKCAYTVIKYRYDQKEATHKAVSYKTNYPKDTYLEALVDGINHAIKLI